MSGGHRHLGRTDGGDANHDQDHTHLPISARFKKLDFNTPSSSSSYSSSSEERHKSSLALRTHRSALGLLHGAAEAKHQPTIPEEVTYPYRGGSTNTSVNNSSSVVNASVINASQSSSASSTLKAEVLGVPLAKENLSSPFLSPPPSSSSSACSSGQSTKENLSPEHIKAEQQAREEEKRRQKEQQQKQSEQQQKQLQPPVAAPLFRGRDIIRVRGKDYFKKGKIGKGGSGSVVYEAVDADTFNRVAIKELDLSEHEDADKLLSDYRREVRN